jgi:hypothetical protein
MDTLLDDKITQEDVEFADTQINELLRRRKVSLTKKSAFAIADLASDYKHKSAAMRLKRKKGDLMWQKMLQYEASIKGRLEKLVKSNIRGEQK